MTVGELRNKLQYYNDDTEIILTSDCVLGTAISKDFSIQTNDGDDNSPVYIEFSLGDMVVPIPKNLRNKSQVLTEIFRRYICRR